jgi:lysozyme family protein
VTPTTTRDLVERSVVNFEGGFSDHPVDRGGPTNFGVTLETLRTVSADATVADLQALTRDEAIDVLTELYALRPGYDAIADARVRWAVIDFAIHSGTSTATRALQHIAGAYADGICGPDTIHCCNRLQGDELVKRLIGTRLRFLAHVLAARPSHVVFAKDWFARVAAVLEMA